MPKSEVLRDKAILVVDDEPDVLESLEELLRDQADVILHTATGFEQARQLLFSHNYDVAILDIMGVQGFELLKIAEHKGVPAIMLTAHLLNPEALKRSIELGAKAYLPKTRMPDVVPFLEDVLRLQYRSVMRRAVEFVFEHFDRRLGSEWRKSEKEFWDDLERNLGMNEPAIITRRKQER